MNYLRSEQPAFPPVTDLSETDTEPGGMYSRMEEIGYRLYFEETVTCKDAAVLVVAPPPEDQHRLRLGDLQLLLLRFVGKPGYHEATSRT